MTDTTPTAIGPDDLVPTRLRASGLHAGYDGKTVLDGVDFAVPNAGITAIIGPNGCGKSTLLKALGGLLKARRGLVELDGQPLSSIRPKSIAKRIALLPQAPTAPEGMTVTDLVARGRQPHQSWIRQWSIQDEKAVATALGRAGIESLAHTPLDELSGGQRQRAWIAFTLAQETDILLLDEPTTYLDLAHAIDVLDLVDELHSSLGRTVVMVLHDLNLAARYAEHLVVMRSGTIVAEGAPEDILTGELLGSVFGLNASVVPNPVGEGILVVPSDTAKTW